MTSKNTTEQPFNTRSSQEQEQSELRRDLNDLLQINRDQSEQLTRLAERLQHEKKRVTYRGIFSLLVVIAILAVAANWLLFQFFPPGILTRINGRVNNNEIRLQRIERQLNTIP
ncbi:hypothetical protein Ple7327_1622 [Pleurocapsa sp. PCC 7327]|uniref:hypothetical protein n=1 Tax=Pleurocapsa sp. PCC 7327 TaxID=118163 RepID=UPI00029F8A42|nr:hypothetical protein [Pleurocapsa sp. PCC 7327]AFY76990.1 hypothetical protein Ple7327_1622 [Pleurocapsa sp. PCC 7327]